MEIALLGLGIFYGCLLGFGALWMTTLYGTKNRFFSRHLRTYFVATTVLLIIQFLIFIFLFRFQSEILQSNIAYRCLLFFFFGILAVAVLLFAFLRLRLDRKIDRDQDWTRLR